MTRDTIEAWAKAGESETQEFKETTSEKEKALRTLCAMLNGRGGRVVFGVRDDRSVAGQQVGDSTLERLANHFKQFDPPAFPSVETVPLRDDKSAIVVTVNRGHGRPYYYQNKSYRRVANTTTEMTRDEANRMLVERLHAETRWEIEPATGWTLADLDANEIRVTIDEAVRRGRLEHPGSQEIGDLLRGLRLVKDGVLLRAAAVLFGHPDRVETEYRQCLLRVAKFRGVDKTEFLDNRQFYGNAFYLLSRAERFLRENLPIAGRVVPNLFERIDDPLYPPVALREALANAICHRDYAIGGGSVAAAVYDDRLEITSAGQLPFGLTPAALFLPHASQPWNPLIADVFYRRGVIERWGRGTLRMAELTADAGLPKPEITDAHSTVTVTFRPSRYIPPSRVTQNITDQQRRILGVIAQFPGGCSRAELIAHLSPVPDDGEVKTDLQRLKSLDLICPTGHGRGAKWKLVKPAAPTG